MTLPHAVDHAVQQVRKQLDATDRPLIHALSAAHDARTALRTALDAAWIMARTERGDAGYVLRTSLKEIDVWGRRISDRIADLGSTSRRENNDLKQLNERLKYLRKRLGEFSESTYWPRQNLIKERRNLDEARSAMRNVEFFPKMWSGLYMQRKEECAVYRHRMDAARHEIGKIKATLDHIHSQKKPLISELETLTPRRDALANGLYGPRR